MATLAEQLASVQTAIAAIEGGAQSYSIGTGGAGARSLTRADLKTLYARETDLKRQIARAARGGMRVRQGVPL